MKEFESLESFSLRLNWLLSNFFITVLILYKMINYGIHDRIELL